MSDAGKCRMHEHEKSQEKSSVSDRARARMIKVKEKLNDANDLPTPPPDPWSSPCSEGRETLMEQARPRSLGEEEDIVAYLTSGLGTPPYEGQTSECPSRNSATSNAAVATAGGSFCSEDAFEHLDRLYGLAEQILELRDRSSRLFRRVRDLERAKVLRTADRRVEIAVSNGEDPRSEFPDDDAGFAESLLDAMLFNGRDPQLQRRNAGRAGQTSSGLSSTSARQRSRSLATTEQSTLLRATFNSGGAGCGATRLVAERKRAGHESSGAPKISKWTRVKAAFKWERACTNDLAESTVLEPSTPTPATPTSKYLRIPEALVTGSWSGSTPCASEASGATSPIGRVSSVSSSNEDVFDVPRRQGSSDQTNRQNARTADEMKKDELERRTVRSVDCDSIKTSNNGDVVERTSAETTQGKPVIRIITENDSGGAPRSPKSSSNFEKEREGFSSSKKPTPTLTITIPSNEDDPRSVSSPESTSPLPSSAMDSGESSPRRGKGRLDASCAGDFKRQRSMAEGPMSPTPKMQRQDSKWNKVRRAFLTNATFSVPPSPVRNIAGQSFLQDLQTSPKAYSCNGSVEDLERGSTSANAQAHETRRDYQALREKLGAEFHRKLVEWEKLKGACPRLATSPNVRDGSCSGTVSQRGGEGLLLTEDRLTPEFKKKLQEWKRAKKGRRSSASIERQRVSRRRLTDWQLWRSPSKSETRSRDVGISRANCGSVRATGSNITDGRSRLCEDFVRRMEAWRRINEAAYRGSEYVKRESTGRLDSSGIIDESEFLSLDWVLSLCGDSSEAPRRNSCDRNLDASIGEDVSSVDGPRNIKDKSEVLIRTSVGSYRFEGISREFTRKLYAWEKHRGISPRSSTFRLLGPGYSPSPGPMDVDTAKTGVTSTEFPGEEEMFLGALKRSKSLGSVAETVVRENSFLRRSTSLQSLNHLTEKLNDADRIDASPAPNDSQRAEDAFEDATMDDSEPEAVIVDIEDVIEETASPLKGVQPRQTPVYSVAASETTSIAVPLGTVTSSHEPSPVILVEAEERNPSKDRCGSNFIDYRWEGWTQRDSNSTPLGESNEGTYLSDRDSIGYDVLEEFKGSNDRTDYSSQDDDSVRSYHSITSADWNQSDRTSCDIETKIGASTSSRCEIISETLVDTSNENREHGDPSIGAEITETVPRPFLEEVSIDSTRRIADLDDLNASTSQGDTVQSTDLPCENRGCVEREGTDWEEESDEVSPDRRDRKDMDDGEADEWKDPAVPEVTPFPRRLTPTEPTDHYHDINRVTSTVSTNSLWDDKENASASSPCNTDKSSQIARLHYGEIVSDYRLPGRFSHLSSGEHTYEQISPVSVSETPTWNNRENRAVDRERLSEHGRRTRLLFKQSQTLQNENLIDLPIRTSSNGLVELSRDPTVRTTPLTVSTYPGDHCYERIIINETTLNKIVVPTASKDAASSSQLERIPSEGCESASIVGKRISFSGQEEQGDQDEKNRVADNGELDSTSSIMNKGTNNNDTITNGMSSSRNVFVKTKRMIFSPFRRMESERPASGRDSDESSGSLQPRTKSKSRSVSPKIARQDTPLRLPLSLPWPLRSSWKEHDVEATRDTETQTKGNRVRSKKVDTENEPEEISDTPSQNWKKGVEQREVVELHNHRVNSTHVTTQEKSTSESKTFTLEARNDNAQSGFVHRVEKLKELNLSSNTRFELRQTNRFSDTTSFVANREEGRMENLMYEGLPSDLAHKLKILTNAVAIKDGRSSIASIEDSSTESRASRLRRAKESFLSHRGGPYSQSGMGSSALEIFDRANRFGARDEFKSRMTRDLGFTKEEETSRKKNCNVAVATCARETSTVKRIIDSNVALKNEKSVEQKLEDAITAIETVHGPCSSSGQVGTSQVNNPEDFARTFLTSESTTNSRPDLVKSASAGMINVDQNTFERLSTANRGCESLPRTSSKKRDTGGPFARIVGKLKFSRLLRGGQCDDGNMSTISKLCRQSLLVEVQPDVVEQREGESREDEDEAI